MIITPTSLTVNQLFGSANEQYVIPAYQRRYSWHERQVWDLIDDIRLIENADTHLLGSIVCLAGHHTAGLNRLELVDGQQRLTTLSIVLECLRQRLASEGEDDESAELARLLAAKALGGKAVSKVALDSIDSAEFERLVKQEPSPETENPDLEAAFRIVREWLASQDLGALSTFLYRLRNQAIVIRLDVAEAKDAFKLFETINNRGLRLSPTDIVKNFLLGNAARFGEDALQQGRKAWADLVSHLDGTSPDAFFRYYVMTVVRTRVTVREVVTRFKAIFMQQVKEAGKLPERHLYPDPEDQEEDEELVENDAATAEPASVPLRRMSFKEFLDRLAASARVYSEIVSATTGDAKIDRRLRNLQMIKAAQTYGFLMHLRAQSCPDKDFRQILELTEAFVLRRHTCRERANETEALFARLCGIDAKDPLAATREAYRELCPSDEKFRDEFAAAAYSATVMDRARYILERLELSQLGDHDELQVLGADDVHIEHVMPQKIKSKRVKEEFGDWVEYLGANAETRHPKYVGRIGNLTLFAGPLNIGASNNPFARKKAAYKKSAIQMTKELATLGGFGFTAIDKRSKDFAAKAVALWPAP
jgi:hypothetical protein